MTFSETLFMFSRGRRFYEIVGKYYLLKTSTEQIFYSVWNRRRSVKLCSCFPDIEGFMRLRANTLSAQSRLVWVGLYKPDKLHNVFVQIDLFVKYEDFLESSKYTASLFLWTMALVKALHGCICCFFYVKCPEPLNTICHRMTGTFWKCTMFLNLPIEEVS